MHPKSDYTRILAFRTLINKSQPVKLAVYRFLSAEEAPRLLGVFTLLGIEAGSGCSAISRVLFSIKYPDDPFEFLYERAGEVTIE